MKIYLPLLLLIPSNIIMILAWYGHLKFDKLNFWLALFLSWGIAFFEYWLHVYAHREVFSDKIPLVNLKIIQEVIHLIAFMFMANILFGKFEYKWNHYLAFLLIIIAVGLIFKDNIFIMKK